MKIRYRFRFSKLDRIRFIGHLDLMKLTQRCIKMAGVPIAYSSGFNPHQLLFFALPLSLGMGSVGEYMEMELAEELPAENIIEALNDKLPPGLEILKGRRMEQGEKSSASLVRGGLYKIKLPRAVELESALKTLMDKKELLAADTKKAGRTLDIRLHIFELTYLNENEFTAMISSGSSGNLKPDLLLRALHEEMGMEYKSYDMSIMRMELLQKKENDWLTLD